MSRFKRSDDERAKRKEETKRRRVAGETFARHYREKFPDAKDEELLRAGMFFLHAVEVGAMSQFPPSSGDPEWERYQKALTIVRAKVT